MFDSQQGVTFAIERLRLEGVDVEAIKRKYQRNARFYDLPINPFVKLRAKAVEKLDLRGGETVLDLGCGTGLSFELLRAGVGPEGKVIGVELSPHMLERARDRVEQRSWANVELIESNAEDVEINDTVDAVFSFYTHDIMQSAKAVERAIGFLRLSGAFVAAGGKRSTSSLGILANPFMLLVSMPYITDLSGTRRPWQKLESLIGPLDVKEYFLGTAYIAVGRKG